MQSHTQTNPAASAIFIKIFDLPSRVDLEDLQPNKKLLSDEEISAVKLVLKTAPNGRHKKHVLKTAYDVVKLENRFFAVYKGIKHDKDLNHNSEKTRITKLAQDLDSSEWFIIKILADKPVKEAERLDIDCATLSCLTCYACTSLVLEVDVVLIFPYSTIGCTNLATFVQKPSIIG